jgi:hypothetical protein
LTKSSLTQTFSPSYFFASILVRFSFGISRLEIYLVVIFQSLVFLGLLAMSPDADPAVTNRINERAPVCHAKPRGMPTIEASDDDVNATSNGFDRLPNGDGRGPTNCYHHSIGSSSESTTLEDDGLEPIAIVGLALKFPQDATSPEAFWQMLVEGRSAMTDVPKERFNVDAFQKPESSKARGVWHFIRLLLQ